MAKQRILRFPQGFLWGTASSSHQCEGGNTNNQWYRWEQQGRVLTGESSEFANNWWVAAERDFELAEQMEWRWPNWIIYPTGGGTGLIGMWKAFDEMERLGWIGSERPRMFTVQSSGCAPVVRAFNDGLETAPEWESPQTGAWGLRVPRAIGDRLMLRALRDSNGGAIAVDESQIETAAAELRTSEGIDAGPEAGAALLALRTLRAEGTIREDEVVVLFSTGGNKYH